jgi:hypothetical protein
LALAGTACKRESPKDRAPTPPAPQPELSASTAAPPPLATDADGTCQGPYRSFWDDESNTPPAGSPRFRLSQAFPKTLPVIEKGPWLEADPFNAATLNERKTQSDKYIRAVLKYILEGNIGRPDVADFDVCTNPVRKWFHVPWMDANGRKGREYVHGMTRELGPDPQKLDQTQAKREGAWAVGIYNERGGYAIGQIFGAANDRDIHVPSGHVTFPEGTVVGKALFTSADASTVSYLKGAPEWDANVADPSCTQEPCARTLHKVHLAQFDVAVVDARAPQKWVFGTFIYDGSSDSSLGWSGLKPVGLMWGNDPGLAPSGTHPEKQAPNERGLTPPAQVKQSYMFTDDMPPWLKKDLGCAGRLDGPIDNPRSSCMSCHATASVPELIDKGQPNPCSNNQPAANPIVIRPRILGSNNQCGDAAIDKVYFRNIGQSQAVDDPSICGNKSWKSLDFSLQLSDALANFLASPAPPPPSPALAPSAEVPRGRSASAKGLSKRPLGVDDFQR